MYYQQYDPFSLAKKRISDKAKLLSNSLIGLLVASIVIFIALIAMLAALGITLADLNNVDPYAISDTVKTAIGTITGLVTVIIITAIFILVVAIILLIGYFQLGSAFKQFYQADPTIVEAQNIGNLIIFGTAGGLIGGIIPGIIGTIVQLLSAILYIVAFYQVYRMFSVLAINNRFPKNSNMLLLIAFSVRLIVDIISFVTNYAMVGDFIFQILAIIGFRALAKDILLITPRTTAPPTSGPAPVSGAPYPPVQPYTPPQYPPQQPPQYPPQEPTVTPKEPLEEGQIYCPSCGARIEGNAKFCPYCGAKI